MPVTRRFMPRRTLAPQAAPPGLYVSIYTPELGALMRAELERITQSPGLSKNVFELASKALA